MSNRKKIIYEAIVKHDRIGVNKLERLLAENPQTQMAKNTLLKLVNELESDRKIKKIQQKGQQSVKLTARLEAVRLEQKTARYLKQLLEDYEDRLARIQRLCEHVDDPELAVLISYFIKLVSFLDWKFYTVSRKYEDTKLNALIKRFESLKKDLYEMISVFTFWNEDIAAIIDERLNGSIEDYQGDFDADLEGYEYDIEPEEEEEN